MLGNFVINPSDYVGENKKIGEGNFGSVYLVHHKDNKDIKIALKIIQIDLSDKDLEKEFIREISIMSILHHPCLIEFVGFSQNKQSFHIYSKYLPNRTLEEILKEDEKAKKHYQKLDATRKSIIVYGIASAMAYLHQNNVVHRDLKPENIFLDEEFRPVLSDFGLSRFCNDSSGMTGNLGTPYYMAPELFLNEDDKLTNKIDVYAYGVTLLSLFTTDYKFEGVQPKTINQLIKTVTKGKRYRMPDNIPEFYVSLIRSCWSNDPNERPSFEMIVNELERTNKFIFSGADRNKVKNFIDFVHKSQDNGILSDSTSSIFSSTSSNGDKSSHHKFEDTPEFDFIK